MPPKTKKELEAEALKAAEEQRIREEQERAHAEEEKKKYEIKILQTGLSCVFTDYYVAAIQEANQDQRKFTKEFLQNYYFREGNFNQNFRQIDWTTLVEYLLHALDFAMSDLELTPQQTKIFLNIMFEVLRQNDLKYTTFSIPKKHDESGAEVDLDEDEREKFISQTVRQQGSKSKQADLALLRSLLTNHSIEQPPTKLKFFRPDQLQKMLGYANKTYFAHYNVYSYVQRKEQRQQDQFQTVFVDGMTEIPPLEQGVFVPLDKKDDEQIERERRLQLQKEIDEEKELAQQRRQTARQGGGGDGEEEEDDLDPIALEIIREKIKEAEAQIEKQLEDRQNTLSEKLQELEKPTKKGAKK